MCGTNDTSCDAFSPEQQQYLADLLAQLDLQAAFVHPPGDAPQEVTVTGIFDSGHWDFDSNIVFLHLETAQVLYNFDLEECHGIAVRTDDGFRANHYQEALHGFLPEYMRVLTWSEMHKMIFDAVAAERQAMYLILFMIMIVGGCAVGKKKSKVYESTLPCLSESRARSHWSFVWHL